MCVFLNVTVRWPAFLLSISKVKWKAYNTLHEASCHVMFNSVVTNIYIIILYIIRSIERAFKGVRLHEWKRFLNVLIFCICIHTHKWHIYMHIIFNCIYFESNCSKSGKTRIRRGLVRTVGIWSTINYVAVDKLAVIVFHRSSMPHVTAWAILINVPFYHLLTTSSWRRNTESPLLLLFTYCPIPLHVFIL